MANNYSEKCKVDGCDRCIGPHGAKGMCPAHYKRRNLKKDVSEPIMERGQGWSHSKGYTYLGDRALHRQVVEAEIGRRLDYNEIVHHIDGNKANNSIENLRVMSRGDHAKLHLSGKTNEARLLEKQRFGVCLTPEMIGETK